MGHFVSDTDLYRVDLGDGEWVDLKREFSADDWIQVERIVGGILDEKGDIRTGAIFANAKALLVIGIAAWHLLADGQAVPLSEQAIGRLNKDTILRLAHEINELNPLRTEAERKNSSPVSMSPSTKARRTRKT